MTAAGRPGLEVVTAGTGPGRGRAGIRRPVHRRATEHRDFELVDVDRAVVALPFLDEPHHLKLGRYVHEHMKQWSATVSRADAFVFVTPEYDYGYRAVQGHPAAEAGSDHTAGGLVFDAVDIPAVPI